ncbi:MAG: hypothetical protein L0Z62_38005 [Gemmataceae bacterium]|nr:hypothetical protein [Gemmataceae bacterium]
MPESLDRLIADLEAHVTLVQDSWRDAKYPGVHAFVLAHGRAYTPHALPNKYRLRLPKACFDNAYRLARGHRLIYVEGFAAKKEAAFVPILHAWCVEPGSDLVIDTTWSEVGDVYFGVPINLDYRQRQGGSVLDHWQAGYPILQAKTDEAEWRYQG